jgi:hypothetical protein
LAAQGCDLRGEVPVIHIGGDGGHYLGAFEVARRPLAPIAANHAAANGGGAAGGSGVSGAPGDAGVGAKRAYRCAKCGQPKAGHVCTAGAGIDDAAAPPPKRGAPMRPPPPQPVGAVSAPVAAVAAVLDAAAAPGLAAAPAAAHAAAHAATHAAAHAAAAAPAAAATADPDAAGAPAAAAAGATSVWTVAVSRGAGKARTVLVNFTDGRKSISTATKGDATTELAGRKRAGELTKEEHKEISLEIQRQSEATLDVVLGSERKKKQRGDDAMRRAENVRGAQRMKKQRGDDAKRRAENVRDAQRKARGYQKKGGLAAAGAKQLVAQLVEFHQEAGYELSAAVARLEAVEAKRAQAMPGALREMAAAAASRRAEGGCVVCEDEELSEDAGAGVADAAFSGWASRAGAVNCAGEHVKAVAAYHREIGELEEAIKVLVGEEPGLHDGAQQLSLEQKAMYERAQVLVRDRDKARAVEGFRAAMSPRVDLCACATCGERDPNNPAVHPYSLDGLGGTDEPPAIPDWVR